MSDGSVLVPVEKLEALVEAASKVHLGVSVGMAIDELKEYVPSKAPQFPVGTTFIARWTSARNGEQRFWVADDGPVCQDYDNSGWDYIDLESIREVVTPTGHLATL